MLEVIPSEQRRPFTALEPDEKVPFVLGGRSGCGVRTVGDRADVQRSRQEAPVETRRQMAGLEGTGASHEKW